jgi:hypothetical protein
MNGRKEPIAATMTRLKVLPRRHRIAHLRALIRHPSITPFRRKKLAVLLRDEINASFSREGSCR